MNKDMLVGIELKATMPNYLSIQLTKKLVAIGRVDTRTSEHQLHGISQNQQTQKLKAIPPKRTSI